MTAYNLYTLSVRTLDFLGAVDVCVQSACCFGLHFTPNVLVYTSAPDSDAEPSGKDGINVDERLAV